MWFFNEREVIILLIGIIIILVIKLKEEKILAILKKVVDKMKNDDSIKSFTNFISRYFSKIWYIFLLVVVSYHNYFVFAIDDEIIPLTKGSILYIFNVILLFIPIVSEIEISGIKIKKQVEALQKDFDDKIFHLSTLISNHNINSNNINVSMQPMPSSDAMNDSISYVRNNKGINTGQNSCDVSKYFDNEYEQVGYLANIRRRIEIKLNEIYEVGLHDNRKNMPVSKILYILMKHEVINIDVANLIKNIIVICNRSIHGEMIDKKYIEFILDVNDYVLSELDKVKENVKKYDRNII